MASRPEDTQVMIRILPALVALLLAVSLGAAVQSGTPPTPKSIVDAAPPGDWRAVAPSDLLVLDFPGARRVAIELSDAFAPVHVANIRAMARAGFYDGLVIERVQDGYVTQIGDPGGKKPLPSDVTQPAPAEYERPSAGLPFDRLPYRDTFADAVGFVQGWPVGRGDVLMDTPAASAADFTVQPLITRFAIKARPDGVSRAFLCTFIRGTPGFGLVLRNPCFSAPPRMNNLHSFDN